jgi:hypothetical protein
LLLSPHGKLQKYKPSKGRKTIINLKRVVPPQVLELEEAVLGAYDD